jgi:tRNA threonylcarbamoyladenosine biosynthesis protein TsaB
VISAKSNGPLLLAIETTGSACSVAIGRGAEVIAAERLAMRYGHGEALLPMIDRVLAAAALPRSALDGIAVAVGPGGFTGIRVGLGAAHGIALALDARLIGITSFAAVAACLPAGSRIVLVALDSRREDLYVQLFDGATAKPLAEPAAVLPETLARYVGGSVSSGSVLLAGDMAETARSALGGHFDVELASGSAPDARGVLLAASRQAERGARLDAARALYLRPPDVMLPKTRRPVTLAQQ